MNENIKIANIAVEVMKEKCIDHLYYGNSWLFYQIALRFYGPSINKHLLNVISTVLRCASRSELFEKVGFINHLGVDYPVFKIKE